MIRRPLVGAAVLCGALLLAACNGSPEAGRVTPAPTITSSPTVSPSPSASPTWTGDELKAITAARSRYVTARTAVGVALSDPRNASRSPLEKAGNGGNWLASAIEEIAFQRDRGWYQAGSVKIASTTVASVRLQLEQPEVMLANCIDSSGVVMRYRATGKPVPLGPSNGSRHKVHSRIVLAPSINGTKTWFLVDEKVIGSC
jgi:hypothetical protein